MNLLEQPFSAVADGEFACPLLPADHALDFLPREGEDSGFLGAGGAFLCHASNVSQMSRSARIIFILFEFILWSVSRWRAKSRIAVIKNRAKSVIARFIFCAKCKALIFKDLRA